jgi:murein DD-endopeptidase MepM/ murein hydrolase activator NlpD
MADRPDSSVRISARGIARRLLAASTIVATLWCLAAPAPARAAGGWSWPITGPVLRPFDPPGTPFGSGHRGIDIGAPPGSRVEAPAPGTVTFAGKIAGQLYVTLDHGGGVSSTYSWVSSVSVSKGDLVVRGQPIALSGWGHPGDPVPSLHFGVKLDGGYVDPLAYLAPLDLGGLIRLAPLAG